MVYLHNGYILTHWGLASHMVTSSNGNIYWPFVRGIHRSPVPNKGQWRGALMFSLICVWINGWVNNREAGDLRRYRARYDVTVMADMRPGTVSSLVQVVDYLLFDTKPLSEPSLTYIVIWKLYEQSSLNSYRNSNIFFYENVLKNAVCELSVILCRPPCVNKSCHLRCIMLSDNASCIFFLFQSYLAQVVTFATIFTTVL